MSDSPAVPSQEPAPEQPTQGQGVPPAAPRRRFPWIPVLAGLLVLQLIGIGVLTVMLVVTATEVVRLNDVAAAQESTINELDTLASQTAGERDQAVAELSQVESQFDVVFDIATVYERCLVPLIEAIEAYGDGDDALGDQRFDDAWADDGPCPIAVDYLVDNG
jgi:hypothetical protein